MPSTGACNTIWGTSRDVDSHFMSILVLIVAFLSLSGVLLHAHLRQRRFSSLSWNDLLARLGPVPTDGITTVALDYLQPSKGQLVIQTDDLWTLVGGANGIAQMRENAATLLALAGYAQQWNFHESVIVAERMRHDALTLRKATFKIALGLFLNYGRARGPLYVQEAASAYYLMRTRLLALYETSHAGRYPALSAAL